MPAVVALLCLLAVAAAPLPRVGVRTGEHPGFGRMVFDLPAGVRARAAAHGAQVALHFSQGVSLVTSIPLPRNVRELSPLGDDGLRIDLAPGARARIMHLKGRLVVDALDHTSPRRTHRVPTVEVLLPALARVAPSRPPVAHSARPLREAGKQISESPLPLWEGAGGGVHGQKRTGGNRPMTATAGAHPPGPTPPPTPSHKGRGDSIGPIETILPTLARVAAPLPPPSLSAVLRFPRGTGAASVPRAGRVLLVFDRPQPLALPGGALFHNATVHVLQDGVVIAVPAPKGLTLAPVPGGWRVQAGKAAAAPAAVDRPPGAVLLRTAHPGRVVTVPDPASGAVLLIGTETAPSGRIETGWQTPDFAVLPTGLGVAVEPFSDRVQLAVVRQGFRIGADTGTLPLAAGPLPGALAQPAAALSRTLRLPDLPEAALRRRMLRQLDAAAQAAPLARSKPRLALAATMLALGMEDDALGVLGTAATTDPAVSHEPHFAFLTGAAEVLAGRPGQAAALAAKNLPASDDVALWRALRGAESNAPPPGTAATLARTAPILLGYPEAVRRVLLPLAVETMIEGGKTQAAHALLAARPHDPTLALARAMYAEATGDTKIALADYAALVAGPDRLTRIRAALRAIDLRVAKGMLAPGAAADALARLDFAWRGDRIALARQEREAEFRAEAGQLPKALAELQQAATLFPASAADIHARMRAIMAKAVAGGSLRALPASALVAMLKSGLGALAEAKPDLRQKLAAEVLSRSLSIQAAPVLSHMIATTPAGETRAALGARLAELQLAGGEDRLAEQALRETAADALPAALAAHRAVLAARLQARRGDVAGAIAALAAVGGTEAESAQADLAEGAGKYATAAAALLAEAEQTLPASGPLDAAGQKLVLRLAADAGRGHATAALDEIRTSWLARLPHDETGNTVRLLLAPPIRQIADLPRAAQETKLAAEVANGLRQPSRAAAAR